MSITNSAVIQNLLRPGLANILLAAENTDLVSKQIFKKLKSDKNYEIDVEVAMLPLGREKPEGTEIAYEQMRQTYTTTYVNRSYGLGFIVTREAIDDNLYKKDFPMQGDALKNSMQQLREVNAASILNNAFDTNFPGGDGKPLVSPTHPLGGNGTTQSNAVSVAVGLNEAAVQDFVSQIEKFHAASGLFDMVDPRRLIVPTELAYNADRLLKSQYRPGTANNDIGVIPDMALLPDGYVKWRYLTSSTAWWIQTNAPLGLTQYDRIPLELDSIEDQDLKAMKVTAYERYSFGFTNFRAVSGTSGVA